MMRKSVLVELCVAIGTSRETILTSLAAKLPGFTVDPGYAPIPMSPPKEVSDSLAAACQEVVLIRGQVQTTREPELRAHPNVIAVWSEGRVAAFDDDLPGGTDEPGPDASADLTFDL
jgi:hypothetical protein